MQNFIPNDAGLKARLNFQAMMAMLAGAPSRNRDSARINHHFGESVHSGRADYRHWRKRKIAMQQASRKVNRGR